MIKLKDILIESTAPDIFIPRRMEDRVERLINLYIRNGSKGNLNLSMKNLMVLPESLKNIKVKGDFSCEMNKLLSLKNSPKYVADDFLCNDNDLVTLNGAPEYVGGDFVCSWNYLTTLEGAPKTVQGDFWCGYNEVDFTEEQIRAVCNVNGTVHL